MRLRAVRTILRKELLDTFRDRRTLFAMVVLPVILYPLLFIVMGGILSADRGRIERETAIVAVWGDVPDEVVDRLREDLDADVDRRRDLPGDVEAEAKRVLDAEDAHLVMAAPRGAAERFAGVEGARLDLYSSEVQPKSELTRDRAVEVLRELNAEVLERRLGTRGLPGGFGTPIDLEERDVASAQERGAHFAGSIIPMLLLVMVAAGSMFPAIDVTAGEKERGTMQTLLVAPVRPVEMIAGKYIAVVLVALGSAAMNLAAVGFAIGRQAAQLGQAEDVEASFSLEPATFLALFALLVPVAFLLAAILMTVSVFARSFREAQNYANPVMLVALLAGFAGTSSAELTAGLAFAPLMNISMTVRDVLRGDPTPFLGIVFVANAAYAVGAVLFASRVFESEQVLLGGEKPWRDIRARRLGASVPSGRSAVLFAVVLVVLAYYGSLFAVGLPFAGGLAFTQVVLLLLPALVWTAAGRHRGRETFSLRWPRGRAWAGAALVAAGTWSVGAVVSSAEAWLFPEAASYFDFLQRGIGDAGLSLGGALLLLAVLPAVCEEAAFRGVIFTGLRSTGSAAGAVAGSALLFGLFHISPYHAVPAAALGATLALAVLWSGSIVPAVAAHLATNAIALLASRFPERAEAYANVPAVGAGLVVLAAGLWLLRRASGDEPPEGARAREHGTSRSPMMYP